MPLVQGQTLNNRYRIVGLLGQGGFGAVYRAWDLNLETQRAIKENLDTSEAAQRQFKREAQILDKLVHSNLPRVIDHFVIPSQGQYLVMDFVEGQDLGEMLLNGPLEEARVLPWIIQVCEALSYLHSQNPPVIHRDIKPGNIKITPEGKAMLVDFGISKVYDPAMATTVGARAITPGYSPPEQYGKGTTDARSDLYALGATLYHLLTGQAPPDSVDILTHNTQPPPPPAELNPDISSEIAAAVARAMELERERRWASAEEFKQALTTRPAAPAGETRPAVTQVAPSATRGGAYAGEGAAEPARVSWGWVGALAALIGVLLLVYALGNLGGDSEREATRTAEARAARVTETLAPTLTDTRAPTQAPTRTTRPTNPPTDTPIPASPTEAGLPAQITLGGAPMVLIPAGPFTMGSEDGYSHERPVHEVTLEAFYIDVYEVTNAQFAEFLNELGNQEQGGATWLEADSDYVRIHQGGGAWEADGGYGDHPVVEVSWYGASAYCEWRGLRLPSEAEWEKAARGGLEGAGYPWGDEAPVCDLGAPNGAQFSGCDGDTVPVGSYSANGYGLFDMAGNVWEWVSSLYKDYPYRADDGREDLSASGNRVLRGGSWSYLEGDLRSADRLRGDPSGRDFGNGFRCARSP